MVSKYSWHIEERQINVDTGKVLTALPPVAG